VLRKSLLPFFLLTILLLSTLSVFIPSSSAVTIGTGVYFNTYGGRNYSVNHTMNFNSISIDNYVTFNTTSIIPYGLPTSIVLSYLDHDPLTTKRGELVCVFNYTSDSTNNYFRIHYWNTSSQYRITRNGIDWITPWSDSSGILTFTTTLPGTVTVRIYDYVAPAADTTPPTLAINFAGNHGDTGGPYYLPPGETTALSGVNLDGYYTNSSYQNESWIYINTTATDNIGITSVLLHWKNQTSGTWKNTTALTQHGTYWDVNTSGLITMQKGHKYSFDVIAFDLAGNTKLVWWNKTGLASTITRRYVYLRNTPSDITYKPLYFYKIPYSTTTDAAKFDRLKYDLGTDGGGNDTGFLNSTINTNSLQELYCSNYLGAWFGNASCISSFTISNIYYHWWLSSATASINLCWNKTRANLNAYSNTYFTYSFSNERSNIYVPSAPAPSSLYDKNFSLVTKLFSVPSFSFTDNNFYEYAVKAAGSYPALISNHSFASFILFNVPSNATLNASYADSDSDGLSDWTELYRTYTNPFLSDTDGDGVSDFTEYFQGSDANNYMSYVPTAPPSLPVVQTNSASGVEETNSTLNGLLVDDGLTTTPTLSMYENYTTGDDGFSYILNPTKILGQTFTPTTTHYITNVSLFLFRQGTPNDLIISIRATSGGNPTGIDLTSGTTDGNTLPTIAPYEWRNISMTPYLLTAGTQYALLLRALYTNSNQVKWREDTTSSIYSGGTNLISTNNGSTWGTSSSRDFMFKEGGCLTSPCSVNFQYGHTTSYGNTTSNQIKSDGESFLYPLSSLTPGYLYHYRATATNSNGTSYGSDKSFLTKPTEPSTSTIVYSGNNNQFISWVKGSGANTTVIRAKIGGYPSGPTTDTGIYNASGTSKTVNNTFLSPGKLYYYKGWSWASAGGLQQYSDNTMICIGLTKPYPPTNTHITIAIPTVNISWTKGTGANKTIITYKSTGYPTSYNDGTIIYNDTGTYYNYVTTNGSVYYYSAFSYTNYSSYNAISDNGTSFTNITGGGFVVYAYDQETLIGLTFNILITNQNGTDTYVLNGCTNPHSINASLCPHGSKIQVIVSASGYGAMTYTINIFDGIIYTLKAYLPKITSNGTTNCIPTLYVDYFIITNTALDALIPLTHTVDFISAVQLYNTTTSYWTDINYTYNPNNTVRISKKNINVHTTMARVSYYYDVCDNITNSYVYFFQVIVDDTQGSTIKDAFVDIRRYINSTGVFSTISSMYTDSNGNFNLYLIPGSFYKIILTKSGYQDEIVNFIPSTANFGPIIIKMTPGSSSGGINGSTVYDFGDKIHYNAYLDNSSGIIYINYTDDLFLTKDICIYIYDITNHNILVYSNCSFDTNLLNLNFTVGNKTHDFQVVFSLNSTYFKFETWTLILTGYHLGSGKTITTMTKFNLLFVLNFGWCPFGWSNIICWFIILGCFFSFDRRDSYIIMFIIGFLLLFINYYIGFSTIIAASSGIAIPIIIIVFGILMLVRDRDKYGAGF
jgi:hypothetical protein